MPTGVVYDPVYLEHDLRGHPENQQRLKSIVRVLQEQGMWQRLAPIEPAPASPERLYRAHEPHYVEQVQSLAAAMRAAS